MQEDGKKEPWIIIDQDNFRLEIRIMDDTTWEFLRTWSKMSLVVPLWSKEISEAEAKALVPTVNQMPIVPVYDTPLGRTIDTSTNDDIIVDGGGKTTTDSKVCTRCGESKPLDDFNKYKTGRLGRNSVCRVCQHEVYIKNYIKKVKGRIKKKTGPKPGRHKQESSIEHESEPPSKHTDGSGSEPGSMTPATPTPEPEPVKIVEPKKTPAPVPEPELRPTPRPPVVWTKGQDSIIKKNFNELGVSGIYLTNLLPKDYSLTDIKTRCQDLKLLDQYGMSVERQVHKKEEEPMEEESDV